MFHTELRTTPVDGFVGSFKSRYKDAKRFIYRIVSYKRGDK